MASLADILRRFRFHGVPGPPGALGVPADRTIEVARELEPVFDALDGVQRRATTLVAAAESDAARLRSEASQRARGILAEARAGAGQARADAASSHLALAASERARLEAAARSEVERIEGVSAERMPQACRLLVEQVLSSLAGERRPAPSRRTRPGAGRAIEEGGAGSSGHRR
jgi:vacuolar-type H+-ATPase subunit H